MPAELTETLRVLATNPQSENSPAPPRAEARFWFHLSVWLWLLPVLVITVMVLRDPVRHSVTPAYREAVAQWWLRQPMEDVLYLPQFCLLFAPFRLLPAAVGDNLWRWAGVAALVWGLRELLRLTFPGAGWRAFALVSLPTLPLMLGAVRNGQANVHLGAAFLLVAVFLLRQKWTAAALGLVVAIAIKPLGLAAAGLAFAAFPGTRWRIVAGTGLLILIPFFFDSPANVRAELVRAFDRLRQSETAAQYRFADNKSALATKDIQLSIASMTANRFADINGLLGPLGMPLAGRLASAVKVAVGGILFGLLFLAGRKFAGEVVAVLWLTAAALYLMLFNPMTETNSYVILAPVVGWWMWRFVQAGQMPVVWLLVGMLLSMSLLRNLLRPLVGAAPSNAFATAWFPAMALVFAALILWQRRLWMKPSPVTNA